MRNILAKDLKIKFVEVLKKIEGFTYEEGNPFLIKFDERDFYIFLKNLSPAYFKGSPDITRVQLPFSDHFDKIFKTNIPFVVLGYDFDNDTMVCWNPLKIKERLNAKNNVSLYSRNSLQCDVSREQFKSGVLSTGEKFVVFRRENLDVFFKKLPTFFEMEDLTKDKVGSNDFESNQTELPDKLFEIKDTELLNSLNPLLEKNRVLEAVELCIKYYGSKYPNMSFKEWFNLINLLYIKLQL